MRKAFLLRSLLFEVLSCAWGFILIAVHDEDEKCQSHRPCPPQEIVTQWGAGMCPRSQMSKCLPRTTWEELNSSKPTGIHWLPTAECLVPKSYETESWLRVTRFSSLVQKQSRSVCSTLVTSLSHCSRWLHAQGCVQGHDSAGEQMPCFHLREWPWRSGCGTAPTPWGGGPLSTLSIRGLDTVPGTP